MFNILYHGKVRQYQVNNILNGGEKAPKGKLNISKTCTKKIIKLLTSIVQLLLILLFKRLSYPFLYPYPQYPCHGHSTEIILSTVNVTTEEDQYENTYKDNLSEDNDKDGKCYVDFEEESFGDKLCEDEMSICDLLHVMTMILVRVDNQDYFMENKSPWKQIPYTG